MSIQPLCTLENPTRCLSLSLVTYVSLKIQPLGVPNLKVSGIYVPVTSENEILDSKSLRVRLHCSQITGVMAAHVYLALIQLARVTAAAMPWQLGCTSLPGMLGIRSSC